ncbi:polysaccharide deacetylase family protein [Vibrio rumoiensis]|uniref:Chitin-binding type-3 domain-containing protein n=1 Tax=Vibrio rumoiensis 1S-45 TaxID=1188252 RepID=A0A1E5E5L3_9VIBR|nr:polysaccharide deacetylase family protein [Vibrio rumoiensis]OEF28195.1 hypothetical protein A1QC_06025 [Vibrio rumoiensis 1S-45]
MLKQGITFGLSMAFMSLNAYAANIAPSQLPPAGIAIENAPQFVAIAFDDNTLVDGQNWVLNQWGKRSNPQGNGNVNTFDGQSIHTTFFNTCEAILADNEQATNSGHVKETWFQATLLGHEMGNHTLNHLHGLEFTDAQWQQQINDCQTAMNKPFSQQDAEFPSDQDGINAKAVGFRSPYLEYNDALFTYLNQAGFKYDASIAEGYDPTHHSGNQYWPYTLDNGSPGADIVAIWGIKPPVTQHTGLWEVPVYAFTVPDNTTAKLYGIDYSLRSKIAEKMSWFDTQSGKIESGDYNLFYMAGLNGPEVLAILKYNLDRRLAGNKAPMTFLAHSAHYDDQFDQWVPTVSTAAERRQALEAFLDYALSKSDVRIVSHIELINWMETPQALPSHCDTSEWKAGTAYMSGQTIHYAGFKWQAKWWSYNEKPQDNAWGSWQVLEACR